jgi:hypothetical protein
MLSPDNLLEAIGGTFIELNSDGPVEVAQKHPRVIKFCGGLRIYRAMGRD